MSESIFSQPAVTWTETFAKCPRCYNKNQIDVAKAVPGEVLSHFCTFCNWPFRVQIKKSGNDHE